MPIRMDLSGVSDGFDLIPDGDYNAYIFKVEETATKGGNAPGTPMLKVQYKLADQSNRIVFDNIVLNQKSAWKFKQLLVAAGFSDTDLAGEVEIDVADLQGKPVLITVGTREATQQYAASNSVQKVQNPDNVAATATPGVAGWD